MGCSLYTHLAKAKMQKKASWSIILQSIYLHDINPFASGRKPNNSGFLDSPAKQKYLAVRHPGRIDLQYLLQAHLCQRNLGAAPPGKEEHRRHRSSAIVKGKGRVQVQQGLYSSDCPLVPHQCPLLPTTGENCQNLEREGSNQKSNS